MFKLTAAYGVAALLCVAAAPASAAVINQSGSIHDAPIRINQRSAPYKLDSVTYCLSARPCNMERVTS